MTEPYASLDEPPFSNKKSGSDEFYNTVLNAWRQERTFAEKLKQEKVSSDAKVNSLTLQIETLSALLTSEKERVRAANKLVKRMVTDYQTRTGKRDIFFEEKKQMEEKILSLKKQLNALENKNRNFENTLCTSTHESMQLEKRLIEERRQIASLRADKNLLQGKVNEYENTIAAKNLVINELDKLAVELQEQLSIRTIQTAAADVDQRFTQLSYEELRDKQDHVSTCVRKVLSERSILIERIVILESRLKIREADINGLVLTLEGKNAEIADMKLELDTSTQQQTDWLDLTINFVSSVVRLPWFLYQYLFSDGEIVSTSREHVESGSGPS